MKRETEQWRPDIPLRDLTRLSPNETHFRTSDVAADVPGVTTCELEERDDYFVLTIDMEKLSLPGDLHGPIHARIVDGVLEVYLPRDSVRVA